MTTTAPEQTSETSEQPTPAAAALVAAAGLAGEQENRAASFITRYSHRGINLRTLVKLLVNRAMAAVWFGMVEGNKAARIEWNVTISPTPITARTEDHLRKAVESILETTPEADLDDPEQRHEWRDEVLTRTMRLISSEAITAARVAYVEATEVALESDTEDEDTEDVWVWGWETDEDPCARCLAMAEKTYDDPEEAPASGGHPGCCCVLSPFLKGVDDAEDN